MECTENGPLTEGCHVVLGGLLNDNVMKERGDKHVIEWSAVEYHVAMCHVGIQHPGVEYRIPHVHQGAVGEVEGGNAVGGG